MTEKDMLNKCDRVKYTLLTQTYLKRLCNNVFFLL